MKEPRYTLKQAKKFKATTDSKHTLPVADNLLKQTFTAKAPNQGWVSDISYVPTDEGCAPTVPPTRISSMVRSWDMHWDRE